MTPRGPSGEHYLTQNGSVWSRYITADWPRRSSCQNRFCKNTQNGFSSICFSPARLIALANRILILPSSPAGLGYLILSLFSLPIFFSIFLPVQYDSLFRKLCLQCQWYFLIRANGGWTDAVGGGLWFFWSHREGGELDMQGMDRTDLCRIG